MAGKFRQLLFTHFKDLDEKDIQKCRSLLMGRVEVTRRWSKKPAYVGLVDTLIRKYKDEQALEIAMDLLVQINQKDLSDHLVQESQTYLDQRRCERQQQENHRRKYVDEIKERLRILEAKESVGHECFLLNEKYTRIAIVNDKYHHFCGENEIMPYGSNHQEILTKLGADSYSTVADLFEPNIHGHTPKIVVLQGTEGIGKTTTALQIMKDWALGSLFQGKYDYAFHIRCSDIIQIPGDQTVADLLMHTYLQIFESAAVPMADPERLLFVIDGFEEVRCPVEPGSKSSTEDTQRALLRKKIFDKSHIIITSRHTELRKISMHVKNLRVARILGFSEDDRKEYFSKYFGSPTLGSQMFHIVQETEILYGICFIPIVCWMMCTVIKQETSKGADVNLPSRTVSSVYTSFLANVLKQQSTDSGHRGERTLKRLCALARDAIYERKTLFWEDDIIKYGLTVSEIQSIFIKSYIFQSIDQSHQVYKFIHLSFQEFLAALFYVLEVEEETVESSKSHQQEVISLMEMSRKYEHKHLIYTARFLCGLLNIENMNQIKTRLDLRIAVDVKSDVLLWIKEKINEADGEVGTELLSLVYLLYELGDEEFAKSTTGHFQNMEITGPLINMDYRILTFLLKNTSLMEKFHLSNTVVRPEQLQALMPWLLTCTSLRFMCCWITGIRVSCTSCSLCCAKLSSVLTANPSLIKLDLSFSYIDDASVGYLCEGLKHPSCNLQELDLSRCLLTEACCADLHSVLATSTSLRQLCLTDNELCDSGLSQLCEGLKHPDCKLQKLEMWGCRFTSSSCGDLALVFSTNQSLTELNIGNNVLMDSGVRQLCEGLRHPDCKLQKLEVDRCSLTESCCEDFSSVFAVNQCLTELDLANNELGDSGVTRLCEGLKHEDCKLQSLGLRCCSLKGSCVADLVPVLCRLSTLTDLNLGGNELADPAVTQLCEGLKHPACRIQTLQLWATALTGSCCVDISSVISANVYVTKVELSDTELGDSGVRGLTEGLRHPGCKVQKLCLDSTKLTDDCVPELCAALSDNQELKQLSLRWNNFTDATIASFSKLMATCQTLSELKLFGNRFSDLGTAEVKLLTKEAM